MKRFRYFLEYMIFKTVKYFILSNSLRKSSNRGASIGKLLSLFRFKRLIALKNISLVFPNLNINEQLNIYRGSLENLTRNIGEFCYFLRHNFEDADISYEVINSHYLTEAKASGRPIVFFSGHISNWEMLPWILKQEGIPFAPVFRHPNNPYIDKKLAKFRAKVLDKQTPWFSKSASGARGALRFLLKKNNLGILWDQKTNNGIESLFFDNKAMTSRAAASLASHSNALIVPGVMARSLKDNKLHYILRVSRPMEPKDTDEFEMTLKLNQILEEWIKHSPKDWLWIHRRWEKSFYK